MNDLLHPESFSDKDIWSERNGRAGHHLALADLGIRGFDGGELNGLHTDLVVDIFGLKRIQAKASINNSFGPGGSWRTDGSEKKGLCDYDVDAFAFIYIPRRFVFYMHKRAVTTKSVSIHSWSQALCDQSFEELLRRFRSFPNLQVIR